MDVENGRSPNGVKYPSSESSNRAPTTNEEKKTGTYNFSFLILISVHLYFS